MDEESSTSKEEGSFHLSNWKKLIYIIAEIEKNVVEDSHQPQSQNIKEETLSNSRWSWPWKIHKGKVISSKIDAGTKTIGPLTIAESLDNKQYQSDDRSFEFSVIMNETLEEKQKLSNEQSDNHHKCKICLFESHKINTNNTCQQMKEDKGEALRDLSLPLGLMSSTNIVAMGIVIPKSIICMSCEDKHRNVLHPHSPFRATPMTLEYSRKMDPQEKPIICTDEYNDKETKLEKSNQNIISSKPSSSSSFCLPKNKRTNLAAMSKCENEGTIIETNKKSEILSLCERNNENLDEYNYGTAYEFSASNKLTPPFKENDNNTSQQTLNKLYCDTKTQCKQSRSFSANSEVNLVGNEEHKKGTIESISYSYPSSSSVVTEWPRNEECSQCVSAIKHQEKHLLMQGIDTKKATIIGSNSLKFMKKANDARKDQGKQLNVTNIANLHTSSKNLSSKNDLENCVISCVVKCENCNSSLKELNNFEKPSTFSNISNENSQGYRSIEKSFELH